MHYHLVLVTKYRHRCITPEVAAYLESQYKRLLKSWDCELLEVSVRATTPIF
ncbi:transposase [Shewanella oncorhynchi]|uniref:transposase n=1 Tax=Shewanella oncorhynchi TaxID=2726434 RepID=UPI003D794377